MPNNQINGALDSLLLGELEAKEFSTGSKGFFAGGKVVADGARYQAQVSAILVGSKSDPGAVVKADRDDMMSALSGFLRNSLADKTFASGKTGVYGTGKVIVAGQKFQVSGQAVRLG